MLRFITVLFYLPQKVELLSEKFNMPPDEVRARVAAKLAGGDKEVDSGTSAEDVRARTTSENDEKGIGEKERGTVPSEKVEMKDGYSGLRKGFAQFKQSTSLSSPAADTAMPGPIITSIERSSIAVDSLKNGFDKFKHNVGESTVVPTTTNALKGSRDKSRAATKASPSAAESTGGAGRAIDFECD